MAQLWPPRRGAGQGATCDRAAVPGEALAGPAQPLTAGHSARGGCGEVLSPLSRGFGVTAAGGAGRGIPALLAFPPRWEQPRSGHTGELRASMGSAVLPWALLRGSVSVLNE